MHKAPRQLKERIDKKRSRQLLEIDVRTVSHAGPGTASPESRQQYTFISRPWHAPFVVILSSVPCPFSGSRTHVGAAEHKCQRGHMGHDFSTQARAEYLLPGEPIRNEVRERLRCTSCRAFPAHGPKRDAVRGVPRDATIRRRNPPPFSTHSTNPTASRRSRLRQSLRCLCSVRISRA